MKKSIFMLIPIIALIGLDSITAQDLQDEASLEMKYWAYRYRLLGDDFDRNLYPGFIVTGADLPGYSIPVDARSHNQEIFPDLTASPGSGFEDPTEKQNCTNQDVYSSDDDLNLHGNYDRMGEIKFGGNPLIEMGKYLGVLATEWKLLDAASYREDELEANEWEIYYGLKAIVRLEATEDAYYGINDAEFNGLLARSPCIIFLVWIWGRRNNC